VRPRDVSVVQVVLWEMIQQRGKRVSFSWDAAVVGRINLNLCRKVKRRRKEEVQKVSLARSQYSNGGREVKRGDRLREG